MRGLAFPPNVPGTRDLTDPTDSPATLDDIPIDPALGGTPLDPALLSDARPSVSPQTPSPPVTLPDFPHAPPPTVLPDQWSHERLPEGDPFAPQNTTPFFPIIERPAPPPPNPKPGKKRRRFHRDEECSFCQGNDAKNKAGDSELMVTCHECGRSGHPSCMELSKIGDMLRSYPWKCIECKNCEVCLEKGDDERILFCDGCDRGWHFDCMNPPINELPEGEWYCPPCQEAAAQQFYPHLPLPPQLPPEMSTDGPPTGPSESNRGTSVASSSQSFPPTVGSQAKGVGRSRNRNRKSRQQITDESDGNEDAEVDVEGAATTKTPMPRAKNRDRSSRSSKRGRLPQQNEETGEVGQEQEGEEDAGTTPIQPRSRKRKRERDPDSSPASIPRVRLRLPTTRGNAKGKEKEELDEPLGMFEGILGLEERDTSKTTITNHDKQLFERSRLEAERKLAPLLQSQPPTSATSTSPNGHILSRPPISTSNAHSRFDTTSAGPSRPTRSATLQHQHHQTQPVAPTPSPVPSTPGGPNALYTFTTRGDPDALRIKTIRFGQYDIKTWYDAPFPEEYASIPDGRMWICEFCLKYMKSRFQAMRHRLKCKMRHPPGDEIYRDGPISIFEVDGRKNKIYCQNLCLLSKMFLDHKSLFYDVEPFLFYVITEVDDFGARFVGYFSKEKRSPKDYNVSCIMTLPVRQRQGWGSLLIDFSFLLSKVEQRVGSPEKPLSSLGALGYRNYWTLAVMRFLENAQAHPRLEEISSATSMALEDVYETLAQQSMIFIREPTPPPIKPVPGQAIRIPKSRKNGTYTPTSLRRSKSSNQLHRAQSRYKSQDPSSAVETSGGPFVPPKHYEIRFDRDKVKAWLRNWEAKGYLTLKPEKLQWTPYLLTRSGMVESKLKEKNVNGVAVNGIGGSRDGSEVAAVMVNGRHSEDGSGGCGKPSASPGPMSVQEEEDELPVPSQTRRSTRREGTQTPRRLRHREDMEQGAVDLVMSRRLRGQSSQRGRETPTPARKEEDEEDARSVRRRMRLARRDEAAAEELSAGGEEEMEDEVLATKMALRSREVVVVTPRKRRRVESESPSKGCASVATDQAGSPVEGKAGDGEGCAGVKYEEDAGTPLTSVTSPSEETVFGMEVPLVHKRAGLPVSDERSTLEMMEMGDEDAEGSDEEGLEVECSI